MMYIEANLNHDVKFKVNLTGLGLWAEDLNRFDPPTREVPEPGPDGYHTLQLWEFMRIFGPHLRLGTDCIVNPTILIKTNRVTQFV